MTIVLSLPLETQPVMRGLITMLNDLRPLQGVCRVTAARENVLYHTVQQSREYCRQVKAFVDTIYGIMATTATTDRGRFVFKVAEASGGVLWIMTHPFNPEDRLKVLGDSGFIGFDLKSGTTINHARQIVEYLNDHIKAITCTLFQ